MDMNSVEATNILLIALETFWLLIMLNSPRP